MGHDVVDLVEDESAAGGEGLDPAPDVIPDLLRRPLRKDALGVAAAPPEAQVATELPLHPGRVHAAGAGLDGIDDLDPDLDEVGQDGRDRAAGVEEDAQARLAPDLVIEDLLARLEDLAVEAGRDLQGVLGPEVVAHLDDVDQAVHDRQDSVQVGQVHLQQLVEESRRLGRALNEVDQELLHGAEILPPLKQIAAEGDHHGVVGRPAQVAGPPGDLGQVAGGERLVIGRAGESRPSDLAHQLGQPVENGRVAVPITQGEARLA
jgi:hypothetical protein